MSGVQSGDAIPQPGEIMLGKYRIERELGRGGMGVVLCAHHLHLDEPVAIKFLLPELALDASLVSRFLREGQASIKIRSEHVVRVLDVATMPGGTPFMVMEYLDGTDLQVLLMQQGPLAFDVAADYLLQAIEALAEAHALGMVHRDLKPANLFLVRLRDGSPSIKVLDFGITKVTSATDGGAGLGMTKTNAVMGSPRYMSPEQMRSARGVDARTDIWALGTVLHELLTGNPPFDGGTMPELLAAILQDPAPPLRRVRADAPPELERLIMRCLEKDPAARPQNVAELAHALAPFSPASGRATVEKVERVLKVRGTLPSLSNAAYTMVDRTSTGGATGPGAATGSGTNPGLGTASGSTNAWGTTGNTQARSPWPLFAAAVGAVVVLGLLGGGGLLFMRHRHAAAMGSTSASSSVTPLASNVPSDVPAIASSVAPVAVVPDPVPSASASASATPSASASVATTHATSTKPKPAVSTKPAATKPGNDLFDGRR